MRTFAHQNDQPQRYSTEHGGSGHQVNIHFDAAGITWGGIKQDPADLSDYYPQTSPPS